ncbi:hypothetical protein P3T36_000332 [Kitasatospora sp. MAP12-15]|uniref:hypothetical protein n=1 Tax=unclassified Kitasatospora TaxID=2633591 RepID=UPI002477035E|nr:hypothetical protein [Kitasatospora sp. MAP12-44]MDH6109561.1 hypothetical protein [Kitasatospora sp. MAP12-44]
MPWTIVAVVGLGTVGLLVLGVLGMRLWLDVRVLSREVDTAARTLTEACTELAGTVQG